MKNTIPHVVSSTHRYRASWLAAALLSGAFLIPGAAHAADSAWTGTDSATNILWTNALNWSGGVPGQEWDPLAPPESPNHDLVTLLPDVATDNRVITLDETMQIGRITLSGGASATPRGAYTINATGGKQLRFAGSLTPTSVYTLQTTWNNPTTQLIINAPTVFEAADPEADQLHRITLNTHLELNGPVSGGETTGRVTLEVGGNNYAHLKIGGTISDGGAAGGVAINIASTAQASLTLSGDNDFTGGVTLDTGGSVTLGHNNALGTGTFQFIKGTISNSSGIVISNKTILGQSISFTNTGGSGSAQNPPILAGLTFNGDLEIAAGTDPLALSINGGKIYFDGVISDEDESARRIVKGGNGMLVLSGDNTFSGGIEISSGVGGVQIDHANGLGTGDLIIKSTGTNAGVTGATITGTAAFTNRVEVHEKFNMTASASGFDMAGDIYLMGTAAQQIINISSSPTTVVISGNFHEGEEDIPKGLKITGVNSYLILNGDNSDLTGGVEIASVGDRNNNYYGLGLGHARALGTGTLALNHEMRSIDGTGTFYLFNSTAEALTLTTNNDQIWAYEFRAGTETYRSDLFMGTGTVTITKDIKLAITTGMTFGIGGTIDDGEETYGLEIVHTSGANINNGGTLVLSGNNTFGGDLNITGQGAIIGINHAGALGNGRLLINNVWVKLDNTSGAAVTNSRATAQQWNHDFGFIGTNDLDLGAGAVDLGAGGTDTTRTVTVTGGKLTVDGVISDGTNGVTTSLTKTGDGELVLGGNNALTGNLSVNAGTLTLNGSNANVNGVILSAGRLNINHAAALGSNGLTLSGSGDKVIGNTSGGAITATLSSSNNWSRGFRYEGPQNMTLQGGSIAFNWTASTTQAIDVAAGTLTIRSGITGASNRHLEKTGAGTLIFNAAIGEYIEYEGSTTVSEGKLQINSANSFAGSGAVRIGGVGTFEVQINGGNAHLENPVTVTGSGGTYRLLRANGTSYGDFALQSAIDSGQNTTVSIEGFSNGGFMEGRFALDTVAPTGPGQRMSDVFSLSGTADTVFILQLQIAPLTEDGEELYLGWNRAGQWVNAILGNSLIGEGAGHFESSWQAAGIEATEFYLGAWGYDVASGSVWAVLDHNSEFAVMVVPEPGTYAMLGIGAALLACWRRRRRGRE